MTFNPDFAVLMHDLLGKDADLLLSALREKPVTSVRLNSRKPGASFSGATPVPWCETGLYLPVRPTFTLDPFLHAGAYYVQDASSMIYREVIKHILSLLNEGCQDKCLPVNLLDLCAAPGGKTTAMIDVIPDGSRVVANEYVASRVAPLRENLAKWGYPLTSVTNYDSSVFARQGENYDIVAVDAPCSGEGMMRKDPQAVAQWSMQLVEQCVALQKEILSNAVDALKPGGFLIFSTCTFNHFENEDNVDFICDNLGLENINPDFPAQWGIPGGIDTDKKVARFMPHVTQGEGLFLALFRKPGRFIPSRLKSELPVPEIKKIIKGKKTILKPEIEDILSVSFNRDAIPHVEVPEALAVAYLRRESVVLPKDVPLGTVVLTYHDLPLGPANNIGSRANNLYPKNWRILMR